MNLPLIFDVTLGLIFIYLSLSLLASEIQEMLATVFQWRAQHLRKSIEIFLAGDAYNSSHADNSDHANNSVHVDNSGHAGKSQDSPEEQVIQLANQIYSNPLIKGLNQEAKGFLALLPRRLTWVFAGLYRLLIKFIPGMKKNYGFFGKQQRSGPSYIPGDTFAASLLHTLYLPDLVKNLIESRLILFKDKIVTDIREVLNQLTEENTSDEEFNIFLNNANQKIEPLKNDFKRAISNFEQSKATLDGTINYFDIRLDSYINDIESYQVNTPLSYHAISRLRSLRTEIFADVERTILLAGLKPKVNEVVQLVDKSSNVYQEVSEFLKAKDSKAHQKIQDVIEKLPPSLSSNLKVLAQGVKTKVIDTEEGVIAFRRHLEYSFDKSMERASGVYKRNAKGVAVLIGLLLALGANADTFHMVSRLSKDSVLRQTVTQNASNVLSSSNTLSNSNALSNSNPVSSSNFASSNIQGSPTGSENIEKQLKQIKDSTDKALTDISLPVGWTETTLGQQLGWKSNWKSESKAKQIQFNSQLVGNKTASENTSDEPYLFQRIINWTFSGPSLSLKKIIRWTFILIGWIVSGIAISMGAPFWFDMINRIVNVRNTGKIPKSPPARNIESDYY